MSYQVHLLFLHTRQANWREFANCSNVKTSTLFSRFEEKQQRVAKTICYQCPVQDLCLELALWAKDEYGVWGGSTEVQRQHMFDYLEPFIDEYKNKKIDTNDLDKIIKYVVELFIDEFNVRIDEESLTTC